MATRWNETTRCRPKIKEEELGSFHAVTPSWAKGFDSAPKHKANLKETGSLRLRRREMPTPPRRDDAGLERHEAECKQRWRRPWFPVPRENVESTVFPSADWEAFRAHFDRLAWATGWSGQQNSAVGSMPVRWRACLLLLILVESDDYGALVGSPRPRFGRHNQPGRLTWPSLMW